MTKQFRPATIFRIPTCWMDQLGPISDPGPSHSRHHDRVSVPLGWGLVLVAAEKVDPPDTNTATAEQLKALSYWQGLQREDHQGRPYRRKEELVQEKILPRAAYEGIGLSLWRSKSSLACEEGR
jgi:hypothetical protein